MTALTYNARRPQIVTFGAAPALNCDLGGTVSLSTAITSALTWAAPSNIPPAGQTLTVTMAQDGTGGWAVSWNAAYIFPSAWSNTGNTANKKTAVTFVSDGSALVAVGANSWY